MRLAQRGRGPPYREDGTGENARRGEADDNLDGDPEPHTAHDRLMVVVVVAQGLDQMVQQRRVAVVTVREKAHQQGEEVSLQAGRITSRQEQRSSMRSRTALAARVERFS